VTNAAATPATNQAAVLHGLGGQDGRLDVVLIHGFGADRLSWLANAPDLFDAFKMWAVDLPGHGEAEPLSGDTSLAGLADAVIAALDPLGPNPFHLVGHSLGGAIAIEMAARVPERIRSISLIAPAGLGKGVDGDFLELFPQLREADDALALLQRLVTRPRLINPPMVAHVLKHLEKPGRRTALAAAALALRAIETDLADAVAAVGKSDIPRMTIWGAADTINPLDPEKLAAFGGEQHIVAAAGHMPQIEDFKAVNGWLRTFLTAHS